MQKHNRIPLLLCIALVLLLVTAMAAFRRGGQSGSTSSRQEQRSGDDFGPMADSQAQESNDPTERAKRINKGNRYKGRFGKIDNTLGRNGLRAKISDNYIDRIPALPATESNIVIVGQMVDAKAYVT